MIAETGSDGLMLVDGNVRSRVLSPFSRDAVSSSSPSPCRPSTRSMCDESRADVPTTSIAVARFGDKREFALRVASCETDLLRCWHLVYKEYLASGYTSRDELGYRYSLHDALPGTGTFLVETQGEIVSTVSVFPDSPLGLPADDVYKEELDGLRAQGRRLVEVGRLTICREHVNERCLLTTMFDVLSLHSRCLRKATDLVITVNPSHAKFYERMLLFERIGEEKQLGSVCEAPAVLMRLDLEFQKRVIRWEQGEGEKPAELNGHRTFYRYFASAEEERGRLLLLRGSRRSLGEAFMRQYFVLRRPLVSNLGEPLKTLFKKWYPFYNLQGVRE